MNLCLISSSKTALTVLLSLIVSNKHQTKFLSSSGLRNKPKYNDGHTWIITLYNSTCQVQKDNTYGPSTKV